MKCLARGGTSAVLSCDHRAANLLDQKARQRVRQLPAAHNTRHPPASPCPHCHRGLGAIPAPSSSWFAAKAGLARADADQSEPASARSWLWRAPPRSPAEAYRHPQTRQSWPYKCGHWLAGARRWQERLNIAARARWRGPITSSRLGLRSAGLPVGNRPSGCARAVRATLACVQLTCYLVLCIGWEILDVVGSLTRGKG